MFDAMDVRRHGARGNGTDDDGPAILRAITATQGGMVYLAPGTYKLTEPLQLTNKTTRIIGAAPGATRILYRGDEDLDAITFDRFEDPTAVSSMGCGLRSLTLEGNGMGVGTGDGVSVQGTLYAVLEDLEILNFGGAGASLKDSVANPGIGYVPLQTVMRNVVSYRNGDGFLLSQGTASTLVSCHAQNNTNNIRLRDVQGIRFYGGAFQGSVTHNVLFQPTGPNRISSIKFDGVHFEETSPNATVYMRAAESHPSNQGCTLIAFRDCWFSTQGSPYFDIERCGEFLIDACRTGGATGVRLRAFAVDPLRVYGGGIAGIGFTADQAEFYDITSSHPIWFGGTPGPNNNAIAIGTTAPPHGSLASKFYEPE
jgi:hypothetical protein